MARRAFPRGHHEPHGSRQGCSGRRSPGCRGGLHGFLARCGDDPSTAANPGQIVGALRCFGRVVFRLVARADDALSAAPHRKSDARVCSCITSRVSHLFMTMLASLETSLLLTARCPRSRRPTERSHAIHPPTSDERQADFEADQLYRAPHADRCPTALPLSCSSAAACAGLGASEVAKPKDVALGDTASDLRASSNATPDDTVDGISEAADASSDTLQGALGAEGSWLSGRRGVAQLGPCQGFSSVEMQVTANLRGHAHLGRCNTTLPSVDESTLGRTRTHVGSLSAWRRVVRRLDAGEEISIVVLGGSMSLAHKGDSWSERAFLWLRQRWPRATVSYHNGAIGGTGSGYFALCADAELPQSFDVLLLDHAVNDAEQPVPGDSTGLRERAAVYEKLLRGILRRPGPPAIFF
eukprot:2117045-Prymnesium_polylepis.1